MLSHRLTCMSLGFEMGQNVLLILWWCPFSDLLGCTCRPMSSQLVLVGLSFWTEAIDQLQLEAPVWDSKPSTPCIEAPSFLGLSLQVHRIPQVLPNERRSAQNNFAGMASETSVLMVCKL